MRKPSLLLGTLLTLFQVYPSTAAEFAVTLVHEFQHSKLSAMLDLKPLIDPADDRRYFAPWQRGSTW